MNQGTGEAIALLSAGVLLGAWAVLRIRSGKSYISDPAMAVSRRQDPFSFWLSVGPMLLAAIALIGFAVVRFAAE